MIDQRPIWEGRVELTHKQAHTCNTVGLFKFVREVRPYIDLVDINLDFKAFEKSLLVYIWCA